MELMDGVILLEEYTAMNEIGRMMFVCSTITLILSIIVMAYSIFFSSKVDRLTHKIFVIIVIIICCVSFVGFFASGSSAFLEKNGRLEVIITQDADMDELMEQYTIIDHENGKYIIEEKK